MKQVLSSFTDEKTALPIIAKSAVRPEATLLNHAESPLLLGVLVCLLWSLSCFILNILGHHRRKFILTASWKIDHARWTEISEGVNAVFLSKDEEVSELRK